MPPADLPPAIAALAAQLAALPGAQAVVLGGSRAQGLHDADSDWDLGVYYRGSIDLTALATLGPVYPPGSWGRVMNGGAWLALDDTRVDVLLRDLDVVEVWQARAAVGEYEVDGLLGYLAGIPTYSLVAELALCRLLGGHVPPAGPFPPALMAAAPARWRFHRDFSLGFARAHAARGDLVATLGQAARAALEEAHARLCARGSWQLNEKRLLAAAGLSAVQQAFARPPDDVGLQHWLAELAAMLERP